MKDIIIYKNIYVDRDITFKKFIQLTIRLYYININMLQFIWIQLISRLFSNKYSSFEEFKN